MPIQPCTENERPGYQWGNSPGAKCYTYLSNNEASRKEAKRKAYIQASAISTSQQRQAGVKEKNVKAKVKESKMQTTTLFEIVQSRNLQIDKENGRISGVRVLGLRSANGRIYSRKAIKSAIPMYEGRAVNTNHSSRTDPNRNRNIEERAGWLENVRQDADGGLSADLNLLNAHPMTALVMEAAERNPQLFGLSHNAEGRTRRENGKTLVEEILKVRSVDLVSDPASTKSLFEEVTPMTEFVEKVQAIFEAEEPENHIAKLRELLEQEDPQDDDKDDDKDDDQDENEDDKKADDADDKAATTESKEFVELKTSIEKLTEQITELKGRVGVQKPRSGLSLSESQKGNGEKSKDSKDFCEKIMERTFA